MNRLFLKLINVMNVSPTILVDNKRVKPMKNEFGSYGINYETEKEEVEIKIYKYLEVNGRLWFLMHMIFFVISIFGLLDYRLDKRCTVIDCKLKIKVNENTNAELRFNSFADSGEAYELKTDAEYEEISNRYFVDKRAQKRLKILKITKLICWLALVATILVVAIVTTR